MVGTKIGSTHAPAPRAGTAAVPMMKEPLGQEITFETNTLTTMLDLNLKLMTKLLSTIQVAVFAARCPASNLHSKILIFSENWVFYQMVTCHGNDSVPHRSFWLPHGLSRGPLRRQQLGFKQTVPIAQFRQPEKDRRAASSPPQNLGSNPTSYVTPTARDCSPDSDKDIDNVTPLQPDSSAGLRQNKRTQGKATHDSPS